MTVSDDRQAALPRQFNLVGRIGVDKRRLNRLRSIHVSHRSDERRGRPYGRLWLVLTAAKEAPTLRFRPSPALLISLAALFFALGGTAFALSSKTVPQPRCATGAVRGIAVISPGFDLSSLPSSFTAAPDAFNYRWSCTGGNILIKKSSSTPGVDVEFAGNPSTVAVLSSAAPGAPYSGSVSRSSDGSFHVTMGGSNAGAPGPWQVQSSVPFVIVLL